MRGKIALWLAAILIASTLMVNISFADSMPTIAVDPQVSKTNPGEWFVVDINITNAVGIGAWEVSMTWDLSLTEFPPVVTEGPFLKSVGPTYWKYVPDVLLSKIAFGAFLFYQEASGSGVLATVNFTVKASGISTLDLFDTKLWDIDGNPIAHNAVDGSFETTKPFVDFTWTPTNPIAGELVTFNASASYDPDGGDITKYEWDFGDGNTGTGMIATNTYADYSPDPYHVTLTCTDDEGEVWSYTQDILIWRDLTVSAIWTSIDWWDNTHFDVFHGQLNPYEAYPVVTILVTVVNLGTQTETYTVKLYADLDTSVIGDEFVLYPYSRTKTIGPGGGSGFSLWFLWDIRDSSSPFSGPVWNLNPIVKDPGLYTLTAVVTTEVDNDLSNNVISSPFYIHARAEPSGVSVSPRSYKISRQGANFAFYGYVTNVEKSGANIDGIWARLAFDVIDQMGTVKTLRTEAVYLENGQKSPRLDVILTGLTLADVGSYTVVTYSEFGWNGVDFPFVGLEPKTTTVDILP